MTSPTMRKTLVCIMAGALLMCGPGPSNGNTTTQAPATTTATPAPTSTLAQATNLPTNTPPHSPTPPPPASTSTPPAPQASGRNWQHFSSTTGVLEVDGPREQTAALVFDIDGDAIDDFVLGGRGRAPALVWYRLGDRGWERFLIDDSELPIEAGGAFHDIDGDGDLDLVMGEDYQGNHVYWWQNPAPDHDPDIPWRRFVIKNSGANKHHDQIFGNIDGDGAAELIFWNQRAEHLLLADLPADPEATEPWPTTTIYAGPGEGLALADIDQDGQVDLLAAGRWFKRLDDGSYRPHVIDDRQRESRIAVGDLLAGGGIEVVMVPGDDVGPLRWYSFEDDPASPGAWRSHDLLDSHVDHGHSLEVADLDADGHLDIFCAEMRLDGGKSDAGMWVFFGDSAGNFTRFDIARGYGNHESKIGDLDGDGDLDILGKPYNWQTPRIDIWLNDGPGGATRRALDRWERTVVDSDRPWRSIFITTGDIDGDGARDIITGGWWYRNPGDPTAAWQRMMIGEPLNNMAAVHDFDNDGDLDILGTTGKGADPSDSFVWARNEGDGSFTILDNIEPADGDFLQGVAVARFQPGGPLEVALSWHAAGKGVQMLTVPSDPSNGIWRWRTISSTSQDEGLSAGDIDGDGDGDLLLGTIWLRNDGASWSSHTLYDTDGSPDRNRLADIDGDGDLDALVGYEAVSRPGTLAWYEQPESPEAAWIEHVISVQLIGPMSLDTADLDGDGDFDVVVGEHNLANPQNARLLVVENADGSGTAWTTHLVYTGDEHHDGTQLGDIDGDGDLDIVSIGWENDRVLLYENTSPIMPSSGILPLLEHAFMAMATS